MLHLTGQAYTWATHMCEFRGTDIPWNTLEELKEELKLMERWKSFQAKQYNNNKEEYSSNEETNKKSNEDNDEYFNTDDYEDCHKEEDCIQDKQLDKRYEEYDEDPDEDSDEKYDLECEDNNNDQDVEEDCEDNDKEYQTEEGFPELESPPTSDNKNKIDEMLEDKIVKLKGKEDDSNILTSNQPENLEEHEDGEGDHIIHINDFDDGEIDQEENFRDEEDYGLGSYEKHEDTINDKVWDPFPIIPQIEYSGYDDFVKEGMDENGDCNENYVDLDKNPNKEEDPKHEVFGKEYSFDKNSDVYPNDEIGKQLKRKEDYSKENDMKNGQLNQEYEDNRTYEETSPKGKGNEPDHQIKELGLDDNTKDDSMTSTKDLLPLLMGYTCLPPQEVINGTISRQFGKSKMQVDPSGLQKQHTQRK
eukprot:Gb_31114 [translate_table: standard]